MAIAAQLRSSSLTAISQLRRHTRLLPSSSLHFAKHISSRTIVTPYSHSPQKFSGVQDEDAEQLGFDKVSEEYIGEYKSRASLFRHRKTGAQVMSLSNYDDFKVFGIFFRTPPKDSTGVPYILQRCISFGTRALPLAGFTGPDKSYYVFSCESTELFYIEVNAYLNAVFFPKSLEDSKVFQQEGWHYELNHPSGDLSYQGVVLNERKEVYPTYRDIVHRTTLQALFPDSTYGFDSKGDPKLIPNLTFEELKDFHHKYYHPSNSWIWFYGDDDPTERLRILSEYLDIFDASSAPNESRVEPQKRFSEPFRISVKYPGSSIRKKSIVCLNWLLCDKPLDTETELTLELLNHLFCGTPTSSFTKILLESGLGAKLVCGGFTIQLLQPIFRIGMSDVSQNDFPKVEDLIMSTLKKIAAEGFDRDAIEASMNSLEFSLRGNNTRSHSLGLILMLQTIDKWLYDMDPFEPLKYEKSLMALKARIGKEGSKAVLSPLIRKFILNNPHRVVVEMQPDLEKTSRDKAAEKEILDKVKAGLTEEDLAELVRATHKLRLKQDILDPPEALRSVPSLSLQDIPKKPVHVPTEVGDINGVTVLQHDLFTSEILYTEVVFDMSSLKKELLPLVPLFCESLLEMSTKNLSYVQLNQLIKRKTGGISIYPWTSSVLGKEEPCRHLIVRGKAMAGHAEDLFHLVNCVLQEVRFTDQQRFKQLVFMAIRRMENRLIGSCGEIAALRMEAKLNVSGWISEQMDGFSYFEFLRGLEEMVDKHWYEISFSLEEIRKSLLSRKGCLINMTAEGKNLANSEKFVSKFLDLLPINSPVATSRNAHYARLPSENEAIIIPTQVNYVGKAANIYDTGYRLHGSAYVIPKYISNTLLWDRLQVSGGAYGGSCNFDSNSGVFSFLSYRDPNLVTTLDVYDGTGDFLRQLEMDDDTLTKAITGTIGDLDSDKLPDAKGYSSLLQFLLGVTEEKIQREREEILTTSLKDFKEFADAIDAVKDKGIVVAVTSQDDLEAALRERSGLFSVGRSLS